MVCIMFKIRFQLSRYHRDIEYHWFKIWGNVLSCYNNWIDSSIMCDLYHWAWNHLANAIFSKKKRKKPPILLKAFPDFPRINCTIVQPKSLQLFYYVTTNLCDNPQTSKISKVSLKLLQIMFDVSDKIDHNIYHILR